MMGSARLFSEAESDLSLNPSLRLHHAHKPQVVFKLMSFSYKTASATMLDLHSAPSD